MDTPRFSNEISSAALGLVFSIAFILYGTISATDSSEEYTRAKVASLVVSFGFGSLVGALVLLRYSHYLKQREALHTPMLAAIISAAIVVAVVVIIAV